MRFVLASLLWLYSSLVLAQFPTGTSGSNPFAQPDFLPVEEAYQLAVEPTDDGRVRLYWRIAEGYYLYQHAFDFRLERGGESLQVSAEVPPGLARSDEFFGDVQVYYNEVEVLLQVREPPGFARLSVQSQGCADAGLCYPPRTEVFDIDFGTGQANPVAQAPVAATASLPAAGAGLSTLPYMLLLAFFGGAILNLMPCVFPVLSLKVLGFANTGRHERLHHGWLYTLGVIASFLAVAGVLIALQTAGQAVGWGFQLQQPGRAPGIGGQLLYGCTGGGRGQSLHGAVHGHCTGFRVDPARAGVTCHLLCPRGGYGSANVTAELQQPGP